MKVYCHGCDATHDEYIELENVDDLGQRLQVGEEVPAGECLKCASLVYEADDHNRLQRASGVLQRDYEGDVDGFVEMMLDEIKDGHITNQDQLYERLHEMVDGAQRVIYTHEAKLALVFSKHDDAYEMEMGGTMPDYSQLAFFAFHRDIQERLDPDMCEDCDSCFATKEHDGDDVCEDCYEMRVEDNTLSDEEE